MKRHSTPLNISSLALPGLAFAALLLLPALPSTGATFNVPSAASPTIQSGIDAAQNGDTVQVAAGTYPESLTWSSKVIFLNGAGADQTIIDPSAASGGPGGRCLEIDGVPYTAVVGGVIVQARLEGIGFRGGTATSFGGGVLLAGLGRTVSVSRCAFIANRANPLSFGGGMAIYSCGASVSDCSFEGNSAGVGGALGLYGNPFSVYDTTLTGCTFSKNLAASGRNPGRGGAMWTADVNPIISNCEFFDNRSDTAGGIYEDNAHGKIVNCLFERNAATSNGNSGGGMVLFNSSSAVTNCRFIGNTASDAGGGIELLVSHSAITGCSFSNNSAFFRGGGMAVFASIPTVTNCTFAGNTVVFYAWGGGGIYQAYGNAAGGNAVTNCIFWGNSILWDNQHQSTAQIAMDTAGALNVTYCDIQDGWAGLANIDADPLFTDAAGSDLHLQAGSACIDAGINAALPAGYTTDLGGDPRVAAGTVDLGVYEVQHQNHAPVASAGGDQTVNVPHDGSPVTNKSTFTLNGSGSDPDGDAVAFQWSENGHDIAGATDPMLILTRPAGAYLLTLTITDPHGASSSNTATITVNPELNAAPTADAGGDQTVECQALKTTVSVTGKGTDPDGDALAYAWYEGTALLGTDRTLVTALSLGRHTLTLTVTDSYGASASVTAVLNVVDTTAPKLTAAANTTSLWPPNGKMTPVVVSGTLSDSGSGIDLASGTFSTVDSYGLIQPSGIFAICPDGSYSFTVGLEARRNGSEIIGRTYTVTVRGKDMAGNSTSTTIVVSVPHDQR